MWIGTLFLAFFESSASITLITALGLNAAILYASPSTPAGAVIICTLISLIGAATIWFQMRKAMNKPKQILLARLTREYELSNGSATAAMKAGVELPPKEWLENRLKELGHSWRV
jgi:hypothetical protein